MSARPVDVDGTDPLTDITPHERAHAERAWAEHLERLRAEREREDEERAVEYEARTRSVLRRCGRNVVAFPAMTADQHRHLLRTLSEYRDAEPCWFRDAPDWYGIARPHAGRLLGWVPEIDPAFLLETVLALRRQQARARMNELRRTPRRPLAKPRRLKLRNRPDETTRPRLKLRKRE
jgi:hypothetical protein